MDEFSSKFNDPKSYCRTCMGVDNEMFNILDENFNSPPLLHMITTCTSLQISTNDGLPLQVCSECKQLLQVFYEFRIKCEEIDLELHKIFSEDDHNTEIIINNIAIVKKEDILLTVKEEPNDFKEESDYLPELCNINDEGSFSETIPSKNLRPRKIKKSKKYKCPVCSKTFLKPSKLRYHMPVHTKLKQTKSEHECAECHRKFDKASKLTRHQATHDPRLKPFTCHLCSFRCKTQGALLAHVVTHSNQNLDEENINPVIKKEEDNDSDNPKFSCMHCPARYQTSHSLSAHMRAHKEKGRILACSVCGKVFNKWSHVQRHERSHASRRPHACENCPRTFSHAHQLKEHNNKHVGLKPHMCPVCNKSFAELSTLTTHVRSHTREKSFLCPVCGKCFDSSTNLNQHMRRHTGEKSFACHLCPGKYVSKGELQSHMSTHTGARPFVCDTCGSAFTKPNSLAKHKLIHLGIRPYPCDVCTMKFSSRDHLKRHQRIHTGEKPYKCALCERSFTQSNDLVKHTRSHLGDNMYKCSQCSDSFRLKTELRRHISTHFAEAAAKGKPPPTAISLAALDPAPPIMTKPEVSSMIVPIIPQTPVMVEVPPVSLVVTFSSTSENL